MCVCACVSARVRVCAHAVRCISGSEKLLAREKELLAEFDAKVIKAREDAAAAMGADCDARVTSATSLAAGAAQAECEGRIRMAGLEKEKEERERCGVREKEMLAAEKQREATREEVEREREKIRGEERRREQEQWAQEKEREMAVQKAAGDQRVAACELKSKECEKLEAEMVAREQAWELERERKAAEAAGAFQNVSMCEARLVEEKSRCSQAVNEVFFFVWRCRCSCCRGTG